MTILDEITRVPSDKDVNRSKSRMATVSEDALSLPTCKIPSRLNSNL